MCKTILYQQVTTGAARAAGRAPSHDGEYYNLYSSKSGEWLLEDNAGLVASSDDEEALAEMIGEAEAAEVQASISAGSGSELPDVCQVGHEAGVAMIARGWAVRADD